MDEEILCVRDLSVGPVGRDVSIVDHVSLTVSRGQMVGIVGESGCGKSMTSLAIMGLLPKTLEVKGGEILFGDKRIDALTERELSEIRGKDVAMIFQEPTRALHPLRTVGRQVEEVFRVHTDLTASERRARSLDALSQAGIPDPEWAWAQYPHQLSGGLNQRVAIAMAIALHPRLIIADEPTTALDVTVQAQIMLLLKRLQKEQGIAIVLISHDLALVCQNCSYAYVMYCGRVVEQAPTDRLFASPKHPYTQALIKACPDPNARPDSLVPIPGTVPDAMSMPHGCRFQNRCPKAWGACKASAPASTKVAEDSFVSCHLYDDVAAIA